MAGYSGTPLIKKLGIGNKTKVLLVNAPDNYQEILGADIHRHLISGNEQPDLIHLFVKNETDFVAAMKQLKPSIQATTVLWVSWYKKSAKIATDVTEDTIRNYALKNDLVDIKVCAVSDSWSGLKLVVPKNKRAT